MNNKFAKIKKKYKKYKNDDFISNRILRIGTTFCISDRQEWNMMVLAVGKGVRKGSALYFASEDQVFQPFSQTIW